MYKACYAHQMREVDKAATDLGCIPSIILMENAAIACVEELKKTFDIQKTSIAVFCGKGNNGGDGLAIARHLSNIGVNVTVYLVSGNEYKGDALINYNILSKTNIRIKHIIDIEELSYIIRSYDIIIDAILGTGISGTVRGNSYDVIEKINENAKYVLSVDVPSGINSDTGEICGIAVKADKTVTFAGYKVGMLMYPAADYTGDIAVDKISIPEHVINSQNLKINVTDSGFVRALLKKRENNTYKGIYGKLLIIAGSKGMSGAAYMSAEAALKSGAGLITLACCESINAVLEEKTTEVMTMSLPDADGHISRDAIVDILEKIEEATAVLIGPGLGRSSDAEAIVQAVLQYSKVPVIVDADAINAVARNKRMLELCACDLVFTPHTMELSRLTGLDVDQIESERIDISRDFCENNGAVLLLKGHHTIVTGTDLTQYINTTGNPGMATGGSGDVLAGIIGAFAARGIDCEKAAAAAAYIHGMAGDIASQKYGEESMSASDILECIPDAFAHIFQLDK